MELSDFFIVITFVRTKLENAPTFSILAQMKTSLDQLGQPPVQIPGRPPVPQRNPVQIQTSLNNFLTQLDQHREIFLPIDWTSSERELFQVFCGDIFWGEGSAEGLRKIVAQPIPNYLALKTSVETLLAKTQGVLARAKSILDNSGASILEMSTTKIPSNESLMTISFDSEVPINTLQELVHQSRSWYTTLGFVSRGQKDFDGKWKIHEVKRGSFHLTLSVVKELAVPVYLIIQGALSLSKIYLEDRILYFKCEQQKIATEEMRRTMAENAEKKYADGIDNLADELVTAQGLKIEDGNGEIRNAIIQAIRRISKFINRGGKVNLELGENKITEVSEKPEIASEYEKIAEFRSEIENIKRLGPGEIMDDGSENEEDDSEE